MTRQLRLPRWWPVAALLLLAALVRLFAIYAASGLPFFTHHRLDAMVYHSAGVRIAGGDWSQGAGVLHMSPAYSYFVGIVYSIFGDGPWAIRLIQGLLGVGTVASIYSAARLLFEQRRWAIAAGAIAALYGPFVFYDTNILAASLAAFAHATLLYCALRGMERGRLRDWLVVGAVWGAAALVRPTALLFGAPLALALWYAGKSTLPSKRTVAKLILMVSACAAIIAPVTIRNAVLGGELVLITDSGGLNFYLGNGPGANGTFRVPPEIPDARNAGTQFDAFERYAEKEVGRELGSKQINAFFYSRTWSEIRSRPTRWLRLLLEKSWLFWNAREIPNTHDYTFQRQVNPFLGLPMFQFWTLAPVALLGLLLLLGRMRSGHQVVGVFILIQLLALVLFFVLAHYRVPAIPALILAATFGVERLVSWARNREWRRLIPAMSLVLLSLPIVFAEKLPKAFDDEYFRLGYAYQVQEDLADAEDAYLRALVINPEHISAHKNLAHLYLATGQQERSIEEWREVGRLGKKLGRPEYVENAERALATFGLRLEPQ